MQRLPVQSSDIVSIGYDHRIHELEIEFKEGRLYRYREVEPDVYEKFLRADSYGTYFFAFISGRYRYERVRDTHDGPQPLAIVASASAASGRSGVRESLAAHEVETEWIEQKPHAEPLDDTTVIQSARQEFGRLGRPVAVYGQSWNILSLKGFPGDVAAQVGAWLQPADILRLLQGMHDRTVVYTETIAYYDGKRSKVFTNVSRGVILDAPEGEGDTFARLTKLQGNAHSMAAAAVPDQPVPDIWQDFMKWLRMQRRLKLV